MFLVFQILGFVFSIIVLSFRLNFNFFFKYTSGILEKNWVFFGSSRQISGSFWVFEYIFSICLGFQVFFSCSGIFWDFRVKNSFCVLNTQTNPDPFHIQKLLVFYRYLNYGHESTWTRKTQVGPEKPDMNPEHLTRTQTKNFQRPSYVQMFKTRKIRTQKYMIREDPNAQTYSFSLFFVWIL